MNMPALPKTRCVLPKTSCVLTLHTRSLDKCGPNIPLEYYCVSFIAPSIPHHTPMPHHPRGPSSSDFHGDGLPHSHMSPRVHILINAMVSMTLGDGCYWHAEVLWLYLDTLLNFCFAFSQRAEHIQTFLVWHDTHAWRDKRCFFLSLYRSSTIG
jgi:hypothetical protein